MGHSRGSAARGKETNASSQEPTDLRFMLTKPFIPQSEYRIRIRPHPRVEDLFVTEFVMGVDVRQLTRFVSAVAKVSPVETTLSGRNHGAYWVTKNEQNSDIFWHCGGSQPMGFQECTCGKLAGIPHETTTRSPRKSSALRQSRDRSEQVRRSAPRDTCHQHPTTARPRSSDPGQQPGVHLRII
jgi:hypothetical protein